MRKMKKLFPIAITAVVILVVFISGYSIIATTTKTTESNTVKVSANNIEEVDTEGISINMVTNDIETQEELEQSYIDKLESGNYTENNMLVVQDPYGNSPLTALVLFKTNEPSKVTVYVPGKSDEAAITHTYKEYETTHEIPIAGLLPDTINKVTITVENDNGEVTKQTLSMKTEALPEYIGHVNVKTADTEKMELSDSSLTFFVASTKYSFAYDLNGDVRWYNTRYNSHVFQELDNGHILF